MPYYSKYLFLIFLTTYSLLSSAQIKDSSYGGLGGVIYLDSFIVTASKNGFNVDDFIELVKNDKSFFKAFKNLRTCNYHSENEIQFFDKKGNQKANYYSQSNQLAIHKCRSMDSLKKNGPEFFTNESINIDIILQSYLSIFFSIAIQFAKPPSKRNHKIRQEWQSKFMS